MTFGSQIEWTKDKTFPKINQLTWLWYFTNFSGSRMTKVTEFGNPFRVFKPRTKLFQDPISTFPTTMLQWKYLCKFYKQLWPILTDWRFHGMTLTYRITSTLCFSTFLNWTRQFDLVRGRSIYTWTMRENPHWIYWVMGLTIRRLFSMSKLMGFLMWPWSRHQGLFLVPFAMPMRSCRSIHGLKKLAQRKVSSIFPAL